MKPADVPAAVELILHADDFGMSHAVNDGIICGFAEGVLTSTSLMANGPAFMQAADQWRCLLDDHIQNSLASISRRGQLSDAVAGFDLGVHLNLTEGRPLTGRQFPSEFLDREQRFLSIGRFARQLWRYGRRCESQLRRELSAQIERVLDTGLQITHLNGHQYIELLPYISQITLELLDEFHISVVRLAQEPAFIENTLWHRRNITGCALGGVKRLCANRFARLLRDRSVGHSTAFFGTCHAGVIDLELLRRFLSQVKNQHHVEIGLHPATPSSGTSSVDRSDGWYDPLWQSRSQELEMLKSQTLVDLLAERGCRLGRLSDWAVSRASQRRGPTAA